MKHLLLISAILLATTSWSQAQKYLSRDGHIWFYSSTPVEDIEAHNHLSTAIVDIESGEVIVSVLIKSFEFEKALMQEHFNENYMESDEFPKSTFKGKITNIDEIDFSKPGTYEAQVSGKLSIHGQDKNIDTKVQIQVTEVGFSVEGTFVVAPEDYAIHIPGIVRNKIAKELDVHIDINFKPYK